MGEKRVLTEEETQDLFKYFTAHTWAGARKYQQKRLGVSYGTIRHIAEEAQNRRKDNCQE